MFLYLVPANSTSGRNERSADLMLRPDPLLVGVDGVEGLDGLAGLLGVCLAQEQKIAQA